MSDPTNEPMGFRVQNAQLSAKPTMEELSSSIRGGRGAGGVGATAARTLSNTDDPIAALKGQGFKIYDKVLLDDQVKSTFQQRRLALIGSPVEVLPGGNDKASLMAADFLQEQIDGVGFDAACEKMAWGIFYGYSVAEMLWCRDGRYYGIEDIRVRRAERFQFDTDGALRLKRGSGAQAELMPERKFWTFTHGTRHDDNPLGVGEAAWCYWPVFFKRHGMKYWMLALEKYGAPTAVGKYEANATQAEKDKLLDAVVAFTSLSGVTIPKGMEIDLLTAGSRVAGNHDQLVDHMNAAISKIMVGQTMTTEDGASLSQSEVHERVGADITRADGLLQCDSFNTGPARWLTEWNFPGATPPRIRRVTDDPEDLDALAERDTKLWAMGYRPTEDEMRRRHGDAYERRPEASASETPAPQADPGPPGFAEASRFEPVGEYLDGEAHAAATREELDDTVGDLLDAVGAAATLDDIPAVLAEFQGVGETDPMATRLAKLGFAARLRGRLDRLLRGEG